jgi:hypothetical protein
MILLSTGEHAMSKTTYQKGQKIKCPHCGQEQEEPVEDFVIPGRTGPESMTSNECFECTEEFDVEYVGNDTYQVS